jgi:hypothetical protein
MSVFISINKNYLILFIFILIIVVYCIASKYHHQLCFECIFKKEDFESKEITHSNVIPINTTLQPNLSNNSMMIAPLDPKLKSTINRVYNPLEYPYKSADFYDQKWYPNLALPFQVIGAGYRNTPTLGGTQIPILNPPTPIRIDESNIAPVNIATRGPEGRGQQMGVLYKIYGNANDILPLFGRRRFPNDNQYDYWTLMGPYGVKVAVVTKNRNYELGNNDVVFIQNMKEPYRVTIYEQDLPAYIPYI